MTSKRADVSVQSAGDQWMLVFVRVLGHSPAEVWDALTDPNALAQWSPFETDHRLDKIGSVTITTVDGENRMDSPSQVRVADRPSRLEYTWGDDVVRWELEPIEAGTRLTLRHTHGNRAWMPKLAAGWDLCLGVADRLMGGEVVTPIRGQDALSYGFDQLEREYGDDLGIEPAT